MPTLIEPVRQLTSAIGESDMTERFKRLTTQEQQEVFELLKDLVIEQTNFALALYEPKSARIGVEKV